MALTSPGVQVSVIDESFYTPAEPGTVPMIFVASGQDKTNSSGTGIAQGTLKENAGRVYLLTSQRDLADTFGDPVFQVDNNNNPVNGGELNEYGLQAAYSLLGVSNRAYVVRADIDLNELTPQADAPAGNPADGTYWFDIDSTSYGMLEWNGASSSTAGGQSFTTVTATIIDSASDLIGGSATSDPKPSIGQTGDYAIVTTTNLIRTYYKSGGNAGNDQGDGQVAAGTWVEVGTEEWKASLTTALGTVTSGHNITPGESINIGGNNITTTGATISSLVNNINQANITGISARETGGALELRSSGPDINLVNTPILAKLGLEAKTYAAPVLQVSPHTDVPTYKSYEDARPTGSLWVKTTEPNGGARFRVREWNDATLLWDEITAPVYTSPELALYGLDRTGGGTNLAVGDLYVKADVESAANPVADFKIYRRNSTGYASVTSAVVGGSSVPAAGPAAFNIVETTAGSDSYSTLVFIPMTLAGDSTDAETIAEAINSSALTKVLASVDAQNKLTISHVEGGEIKINDPDAVLAAIGITTATANFYDAPTGDTFYDYVISNWKPLVAENSTDAPTSLTADGALWYSSVVDECDIMIHNGTTWVGYQYDGSDPAFGPAAPFYDSSPVLQTDPQGPIVSATEPTEQSDGTALVNGDLWVSTADIDNYPLIYRYNGDSLKWNLLDSSDQTTDNGVLFADARWTDAGVNATDEASSIVDLLSSNFLDFDAPDPALYPKGMLLFNTRRSGFNVKRFVRNYVDVVADNNRYDPGLSGGENMENYYPHRWVTESANNADGSGAFGRVAQRKVVVQALQAMLNSNDDIRDDEARPFNLMATPGYPELIGEMVSLNYDRGLSAFIVGDSPFRLTPDATSLNDWANNVRLAVEDNDDGLVSFDEYLGIFYPAGFTSDNFGNNVVVPASHMILRTIALSDQVSYPWFAPAGTRRGGITNATSSGYINAEGEFVSVALNEGQRDTLYANNVNPITFLNGAGLVNYGQKTRARNASALDRINVARLVIYLRSQLNKLAKPYIFEPNDKITRDEIKGATESLLLELVGQRALYDFLVVCDESNNTPNRIDRNELYLDIAIEPVKAVEFIYIPLRLKNTGEIAGL